MQTVSVTAIANRRPHKPKAWAVQNIMGDIHVNLIAGDLPALHKLIAAYGKYDHLRAEDSDLPEPQWLEKLAGRILIENCWRIIQVQIVQVKP